MNWGGFPVGFRFAVQDFSLETKKRCWSYVLPALTYADLTDSTLQEAETKELHDPDQLVYIAMVSPKVIPLSRKNSLLWRRDGRLMSALTLYQPAIQENYLELYTQSTVLADISPTRRILPRAGYESLFPESVEQKPMPPFTKRALILPKGELPFAQRDELCRRTMRALYEADPTLYLKMLPLSPGGEGAAYTAAAFRHGRLFTEMISGVDGEKRRCLFAVLPGRTLLIDGFSLPDIQAPVNEAYGLGQAVKTAKDRGFSHIFLCAGGLNAPICEAKPMEDLEALYGLSHQLPVFDEVILTEFTPDGGIQTETIRIDRRDTACVSSILSKRSATARS